MNDIEKKLVLCAIEGDTEELVLLIKLASADNINFDIHFNTGYYDRAYGLNLIDLAAKYGRTDTVRALSRLGFNVREANSYCLALAAVNGHTDTVKAIVELGVDVESIRHRYSGHDWTAIKFAISVRPSVEILTYLLSHLLSQVQSTIKEDFSTIKEDFFLTLSYLIYKKANIEVFKELTRKFWCSGANMIDVRDPDGHTLLTFAIREGLVELVDELIKLGADVDQPDLTQDTPLVTALKWKSSYLKGSSTNKNYEIIIEKLIQAGATIPNNSKIWLDLCIFLNKTVREANHNPQGNSINALQIKYDRVIKSLREYDILFEVSTKQEELIKILIGRISNEKPEASFSKIELRKWLVDVLIDEGHKMSFNPRELVGLLVKNLNYQYAKTSFTTQEVITWLEERLTQLPPNPKELVKRETQPLIDRLTQSCTIIQQVNSPYYHQQFIRILDQCLDEKILDGIRALNVAAYYRFHSDTLATLYEYTNDPIKALNERILRLESLLDRALQPNTTKADLKSSTRSLSNGENVSKF